MVSADASWRSPFFYASDAPPGVGSSGKVHGSSEVCVSAIRDPIADLKSSTGSLISLYVDRPSPGGFAALLSDLLRPIRDQAETMDRPIQMSVRSDTDRIRGLADQLELEPAPAYAVFASQADDIFVLESLTHSTRNVSVLGPRPYLRPLRAAPKPLRAGVLVADRTMARTFISFSGLVDEIGSPLVVEIGKVNYGGFSGYREHGARARADEATTRLWKDAGARLLEYHLEKRFDYVAIGAQEEAAEEIGRSLHPYLERLHRATFVANPANMGGAALRSELVDLDMVVRRERQEALAGRVCDTAWGGGNAFLGLAAALEAANAQAIETLVVAGTFVRPGVVCSQCGHLSRTGDPCPVCGARLFPVDDVVAALMEAVISAGGTVHQIDVPSPLDVHGVGALTRFPVPV